MAIQFYLLPIEQVNFARGPKYLKWRFSPTGLDVRWSAMDFGLEPVMLVWADVTNPQHTALSANTDVVSLPANIDNAISAGALNSVKAALEGLNIPAGWVTTGHTYRQVLRIVAGLFQFAQRFHGLHGERLFGGSFTMETQFRDLPQAVRTKLTQAAESHDYDTSALSGTSTVRQILKFLADQWDGEVIVMGGLEI